MYFRLVSHYPAMGQANALRALLEERVRGENASGASRSALMTEMMGPEPVLIQAVQHADFAAWEAHTARIGTDPAFGATAAKMNPLMSRPQTMELYNVAARSTSEKPTNYLWAVFFSPALGKAIDLRRLLEERQKAATERGAATSSVLVRLYGPEPSLAIANTFTDLASLEAYQAGVAAFGGSEAGHAWTVALGAVLSRPQNARLLRILVPFPPA